MHSNLEPKVVMSFYLCRLLCQALNTGLFAFEQLGRELQEFLTSDLKGEERSKLYAQAEQEERLVCGT